jgi:23S rRNA (guanosine2251-2'-O)-methyltransferase
MTTWSPSLPSSRSAKKCGDAETHLNVRCIDTHWTPGEYARLPKHPVSVILDNLRSAFNVGSIYRTADAARIHTVLPCGYTAHPPHLKLEKTALGSEKLVSSEYHRHTLDAVRAMKQRGVATIALETADNVPFYSDVAYPRPVCLVVGNEALGVSREVLAECDSVVQIPLFGFKNSLNVSNAFAVVLFEILRQWGFCIEGGAEKTSEREKHENCLRGSSPAGILHHSGADNA